MRRDQYTDDRCPDTGLAFFARCFLLHMVDGDCDSRSAAFQTGHVRHSLVSTILKCGEVTG